MNLDLGLPKPQYVQSPELLISALAWDQFDIELPPDIGSGRKVGYAYDAEQRRSSAFSFVSTAPSLNESYGDAFRTGLADAGFGSRDPEFVERAIERSLEGVRPPKAKGRAAVPLSPSTALLQNARGMLGVQNPPNFGLMLDVLYRLGGTTVSRGAAAQRWLDASILRSSVDPLVAALDISTQQLQGTRTAIAMDQLSGAIDMDAAILGRHTPFLWFARTWDRLCSPEWVEALPARRWVDWATTILRVAVGFGYLWEAAWYREIGRECLIGGSLDPEARAERLATTTLVPWADLDRGGSRDVVSLLRSGVVEGRNVRDFLDSRGISTSDQLADEMSDDFADELEAALSSPVKKGSHQNLWETIRYALGTRQDIGRNADYYGLLRSSGSHLFVEPGSEWIAAVASLAARGPGQPTTVGVLLEELALLGLRPSLHTLVSALEEAGLARGSADADQAVEVAPAF